MNLPVALRPALLLRWRRRLIGWVRARAQQGTGTIPDGLFAPNRTAQDQFYILVRRREHRGVRPFAKRVRTSQGARGGVEYGMHENYLQYETCRRTARNAGLYTADQKINTADARGTRQNPNGNRRGLECPEERDYYPYWNNKINKWADVAVLTNNLAKCDYFKQKSANVNACEQCRRHCMLRAAISHVLPDGWCEGATNTQNNVQPIDSQGCQSKGGTWRAGTPNRLDANGNRAYGVLRVAAVVE